MMFNMESYEYLLIKVAEIEKFSEEELKQAQVILKEKEEKIENLRELIEINSETEKYKDIAFFFPIYLITVMCRYIDYINEFKKNYTFTKIKIILSNENIKCDLCGDRSETEYYGKYQNDYNLLIRGLEEKNVIVLGYVDRIVNKFWNIFKS